MFFVTLILFSYSYTTTCNDATCDGDIRNTTSFEKNQRIAITAEFSNSYNGTNVTKYVRFYPKVDEFSVLRIPDPNCDLTNLINSSLRLFIGSKSTTYLKHRVNNLIPQFYTAFINLKNGLVNGIGWDTSFKANDVCGPKYLDYRCAIDVPVNCSIKTEIKIFLGFFGTDNKKNPCESVQYAPSTFIKFGVWSTVEQLIGTYHDIYNWF